MAWACQPESSRSTIIADSKSSRRTLGLLQQARIQTMMPEPTQDTRRIILADIPKDTHSSAQIPRSTGNKQRATSGGYPNPSILDQLVQGRITAYYDIHCALGLKA